LARIAENWQESPKIGKNRRKLAWIAENWQESPKIVLITLTPDFLVSRYFPTEPSLFGQRNNATKIGPGLPDFHWHNIPIQGKMYQIIRTLPNGHKIYQKAVKYSMWP
jgi:hypothetical protein